MSIAALAVDSLLDAGLVPRSGLEAAKAIVAEEIFARLCCEDYPPSVCSEQTGDNRDVADSNT